jgi:hypothetical protein
VSSCAFALDPMLAVAHIPFRTFADARRIIMAAIVVIRADRRFSVDVS